eukprot:Clim_evm75s236 gene=Clim_evmTU75s236
MVLEATVLCLDGSEWMRNGDYVPSRMEAQQDAVQLISGTKTQQNAENTVGLIAMGEKTEVLVTLTQDMGKILTSLHSVSPKGQSDVPRTLQIAQLVLKHRQNKNQRQRIILFVGSPLDVEEKDFVRIGKKLKKNNISVDVISFGEDSASNASKLEAFISAVNKDDNSHLVTIPPGPHILSDMLLTTPIVMGNDESGGPSAAMMGGMGFNEEEDPELALALRISLEEERARQEAARRAQEAAEGEAAEGGTEGEKKEGDGMAVDDASKGKEAAAGEEAGADESAGASKDVNPEFLSSVLSGLPGVDTNDPRIKEALAQIEKKDGEGDDKEKKDDNMEEDKS